MATLRRQGADDQAEGGAEGGGGGGRVIVMRSRFQGSSAEEVWASLASSLAREEVERLCPAQPLVQDSEDVSDKTVEDMSDDNTDTNEDNDGSDDEDKSEEVNNDPEEYFETSQYNFYNKRTDEPEPEVLVTEPPEEEEVSPRVERGDQTTSVRDLARNSAADDPSVSQSVFTITGNSFSWLKVPRSAFTFKTLLKHYAKC